MKPNLTVDRAALVAFVFAVVAIGTVSVVSVIALENLIGTSARALGMQRIISSLEAIRFHALAIDNAEGNYVITGALRDKNRYREAEVEMRAEMEYLRGKRAELPNFDARYALLRQNVEELIEAEKKIVDARAANGFDAAKKLILEGRGVVIQQDVIMLTRGMLLDAKNVLGELERQQVALAERTQQWIVALISSSALVLVFFHGIVRRLSNDQIAAREKIAYYAMHDSLTRLPNRPAAIEHLDAKFADAATERALGGFTVMLLDLDGFKAVNDAMGHDAGDELLTMVAQRAINVLRDSDFFARLGGDEFLVVLPQISEHETAGLVANKLIESIAKPYALKGGEARVTVSIGVSSFPEHGDDREVLMKCADIAMYAAKRAGRNRACFFEKGLRAR